MNKQAHVAQQAADANYPEPAALSVEAFMHWAGISRFLFYQEVKRGRIQPRKCGGRTMIPVEEANCRSWSPHPSRRKGSLWKRQPCSAPPSRLRGTIPQLRPVPQCPPWTTG